MKVATGIYAPFAFKDENSKLVGYDLDLLDAMSKKLGFTYKVTPTEYDNMFMAVANGEYDIGMGQVCITEDRKKRWTSPNLMKTQDCSSSSAKMKTLRLSIS